MNNTIRNGQAIAESINGDMALANEVALNLSDQALEVIITKRAESAGDTKDFQSALSQLLNS
jgi:hypothetical protein